jgi:H/ACA ribonucleoprotein complex subunit 4
VERSIEELIELGIVVIDKPCGPSSHEVSSWVRKILSARKTGHAGTLDPNVSGVLPVGVNSATKMMGFLLKSSKEYVGVIRFHKPVERSDVEKAFEAFTGEITQLPPVRSAVRRRERKRKVYYLQLLEDVGPEALFLVGCEAGTYVRKLCFDIGRFLGCGAHMLELRRTRAGTFDEKAAVTLQELSDAVWLWRERSDEKELRRCIHPVEDAVDVKRIWLRDSAVEAVCTGAQLALPGVARFEKGIQKGDKVALMTLKGELVAIAEALADDETLQREEKGVAAKTLRVVMKSGVYPRMWKTAGNAPAKVT